MENKICVISGATSGIGWEAAHQMAKKGFDLKIIGRTPKKLEALKESIQKQTEDCGVEFYTADLSVLTEAKRVVEEIKTSTEKIHALINNAGGVFSNFSLTEEGIEKTMANNHLGYFVITLGLLDLLKEVKDGRIVIVGSGSHYKSSLDFDSFTQKKGYNIMKAYAQSKLANLMFAYQLTRKLKGSNISTFVLHPGVVKTPIGAKSESWLHRTLWKVFAYFRYNTTPEESARTYVYLASEIEAKAHNGFYFHQGLIEKSSNLSYDEDMQEKLWKWSEEVTGVRF